MIRSRRTLSTFIDLCKYLQIHARICRFVYTCTNHNTTSVHIWKVDTRTRIEIQLQNFTHTPIILHCICLFYHVKHFVTSLLTKGAITYLQYGPYRSACVYILVYCVEFALHSKWLHLGNLLRCPRALMQFLGSRKFSFSGHSVGILAVVEWKVSQ